MTLIAQLRAALLMALSDAALQQRACWVRWVDLDNREGRLDQAAWAQRRADEKFNVALDLQRAAYAELYS